MKKSLNELLELEKEELIFKMKNVYEKQKLTRIQGYIARALEIIFLLIFIFSGIGILYSIIFTLAVIYSIYRFLNPNGEDKDYYEKFELFAEGFENFKRYEKGELKVDIEEKGIKKLEKNLERHLPYLIEDNWSNKMLKISAFIPIVNIRADEMSMFRDTDGSFYRLFNGGLKTVGLKKFTNEELGIEK
ncbi:MULTISPECIES: hypothetical protein [Fusobacterium]|uniref:hypothetical protein n=1 Tax=Fusobacterium TaxID=848 RepID=UPI0014770703|nr:MULTISPECIES: hypothetical protein [Fusobacterium]NME35589.1 hypothetical protein [Fusobacterium sp. FSA-380-WT-3A]